METHKELFDKIEEVEKYFSTGSIKYGQKALKAINNEIKLLKKIPNKLKHKHNFVLAQSRYFNDISSFAVEPKRDKLIKEIKELANSEIDPKKKSQIIHAIQTQWQKFDHSSRPATRKQWNAFKEEIDKAWEPCAEFFNELDRIKEKNALQRKELIKKINIYVNSELINKSSGDIYKFSKFIFTEWQKYSPVRDEDFHDLKKEFNEARSPIIKALSKYEEKHASTKKDLIQKVTELDSDDNKVNLENFMMLKQSFIKIPSAGKNEKKLWNKFNKAGDKFFEIEKNKKIEKIAVINKMIDELDKNSDFKKLSLELANFQDISQTKEFIKLSKIIKTELNKINESKRNKKIQELKNIITNIDKLNSLETDKKITNLFIDSTYENNLNICRQVTVELEVFAGVKVPKVDEKLREVASVKLLQEKFNAKSSPKEFYLNNLKVFISNLSGKKPITKEIKMWNRIIDLHDYFLS